MKNESFTIMLSEKNLGESEPPLAIRKAGLHPKKDHAVRLMGLERDLIL